MSVTDRLRQAVRRSAPHFARILFPYGTECRVVRGPLKGLRYTLAPGMGATYALGHASYAAEWWSERVRAGMVVYDIGANRGQAALMFARFVGAQGLVLSFEPWPDAFKLLLKNLALNAGLPERVRARQCAVAATSGRTEFLCNDSMPTQGKLSAVEPTYKLPNPYTIEVETVSIDDLIAEPNSRPPDVIKIDVEGAAAEVLRGARATLARYKPAVYLELHGPDEQVAVRDHLQAAGYRLWREDGTEVFDPVARWENPLWCTPA